MLKRRLGCATCICNALVGVNPITAKSPTFAANLFILSGLLVKVCQYIYPNACSENCLKSLMTLLELIMRKQFQHIMKISHVGY